MATAKKLVPTTPAFRLELSRAEARALALMSYYLGGPDGNRNRLYIDQPATTRAEELRDVLRSIGQSLRKVDASLLS